MVRRLLLGVVLTLVALAAPSVAQSPIPRPPFPLHSFIDSPSQTAYNTYEPGFHISGWAYDCRTGTQPPFVAVLHGDFDANPRTYTWITDYTVRRELARPDVQAAHQSSCPNLTANVGFAIYPEIPLTSGRHTFTVFWSDSNNLARSTGVWVIVP